MATTTADGHTTKEGQILYSENGQLGVVTRISPVGMKPRLMVLFAGKVARPIDKCYVRKDG